MKIIFTLLALCFVAKLGCQPINDWNEGSVVLKTNEVLAGEIQLFIDFNSIVLKSNGVKTFIHARNIHSFRYHDKSKNINRQFISLQDDWIQNKFYEVVVQGECKVIRSLDNKHLKLPNDKEDFHYYVYLEDKLTPLKKFKNKVLPLLKRHSPSFDADTILRNDTDNDLTIAIKTIKEFNGLINNQLLISASDRVSTL